MMRRNDLNEWLEAAIARSRGAPVLLLGDTVLQAQGKNVTRVAGAGSSAALSGTGRRFDLAILVGVLENLDREPAAALLATLRDLTAKRLLIAVTDDPTEGNHRSVWSREDMLAHGLEALGEAEHAEITFALYGFDIDRYKRTPDWLNARGWANPENWDKYRW